MRELHVYFYFYYLSYLIYIDMCIYMYMKRIYTQYMTPTAAGTIKAVV